MIELTTKRATGLDALRGFAILTMVLSGMIPWGVLPSWMYHAQVPPPNHVFNPNLPGITWVDLVFPFFLFALGAAIPLALSKRRESGESTLKIIGYVVERTFLLGFFAILHRHFSPYVISQDQTATTWLLALAGFLVMFAIYVRTPKNWNKKLGYGVKIAGWIGAVLMLALLKYPDGTGLSLYRNNIILVVLTNVFFFGSIIWLLTSRNILLRLAILGVFFGLRLSHEFGGWIGWVWNFSPIPWMYKMDYLKYLFIVLPGTIVGDMIVDWMKRPADEKFSWSPNRVHAISDLMMLFVIILLVGLKARWLWQTSLVTFVLLITVAFLFRKPINETELLLKRLFVWGAIWIVLGLVFEPFEGGIKKDHSTMSYYFLTTGLAIFMLISFMIIIDVMKRGSFLRLLIDNGQNPMIAYSGMGGLVMPALCLTSLHPFILRITASPWIGFCRGLVYTILLALIVSFFTKKKIFWRT
ncbi:MAG: DUF5009 domain-containing protein [Candidatus Marinimicrobia bacterium CG08_land_8_20_14_0_20_45_22]|nr:MAG: DUF5009 domain-containing protein [Candidatus Marinimicrobia bacterium CG08_land_8_20_14_0_20_45_22]